MPLKPQNYAGLDRQAVVDIILVAFLWRVPHTSELLAFRYSKDVHTGLIVICDP